MPITKEETLFFTKLKEHDKIGLASLIDINQFMKLSKAKKIAISQEVIDSIGETSFLQSAINIISEFVGNPLSKTRNEKIQDIHTAIDRVIPNRKAIEKWNKATKIISKAIHLDGFNLADTVRVGIAKNENYLVQLAQNHDGNIPILKLNKQQRTKYELQYKNHNLYLNDKIADSRGKKSKSFSDTLAFIMSKSGQLYVGEHLNGRIDPKTKKILFHSSFIEDEPAEMAGMISIKNGKITMLSNNSGHYTPKALDMYRGIKHLQQKMPNIFAPGCIVNIFNGANSADINLNEFISYMEQKISNNINLHQEIRNQRLSQYKKYIKILTQKDIINKENEIFKLKQDIMLEDIGTDLHKAIFNKDIKAAELLANDKSIDINQKNLLGRTALYNACASSINLQLINMLYKRGANINIKDIEGKTALHYACERNTDDIAIALIKMGANINEQDNNGKTALHYACREMSKKAVHFLVDNGADINIEDNKGVKAQQYVNSKNIEGIEMIKKLLKDIPISNLDKDNSHLINRTDINRNYAKIRL